MSRNLIVCAFWVDGDSASATAAMAAAARKVDGYLPDSGGAVSISEASVERVGWDVLQRDLEAFDLAEAASPQGA